MEQWSAEELSARELSVEELSVEELSAEDERDADARRSSARGDADPLASLFGVPSKSKSSSGSSGGASTSGSKSGGGDGDLLGGLFSSPAKARGTPETEPLTGVFSGKDATAKASPAVPQASAASKKAMSSADLFAPIGGALNDMVSKAKKGQQALTTAVTAGVGGRSADSAEGGSGGSGGLAHENALLRRELQEKDAQLEALQDNLKAVFNSQEADALARKEIEIHRLNEAVDMLRAQLKAQERSAAATAPLVDVPTDPANGVAAAVEDVLTRALPTLLARLPAPPAPVAVPAPLPAPPSVEVDLLDLDFGAAAPAASAPGTSAPASGTGPSLAELVQAAFEDLRRDVVAAVGGRAPAAAVPAAAATAPASGRRQLVESQTHDDIAALQVDLLQSQQQVRKLEEELQRAEGARTSRLQDAKRKNDEEMAQKNEELSNLRKALAAAQAARAASADPKEVEALRAAVDPLKSQVEELKKTNKNLTEQGTALYKKYTALKEEKVVLTGQLTAATEQAEKAEQLAESRRRATDQAVREKEELISAHRKEAADLRAALEAVKAELDAANTARATDHGGSAPQTQTAEYAADRARMQAAAEASAGVIHQLRADLAQQTAEAEAASEEHSRVRTVLEEQVSTLQAAVATVEASAAEMAVKLAAAEEVAAQAEARVEDAVAERRAAEKKLAQAGHAAELQMKDMKKSMDKRKADDSADADASAQARADGSARALADDASRAAPTSAMNKASHDDMWATIETAVNVAVRKAESKFKMEREQLEQQISELQADIDTLRRDGEAKAKIIHEYLMRERSGQLAMRKDSAPSAHGDHAEPPARSSTSGSASEATSSPVAMAREVGEQLFSPLSNMIKKRSSAARADSHADALQDENRKLQRIVEETMLKNRQLQEIVSKLGEEIDRLHQRRS